MHACWHVKLWHQSRSLGSFVIWLHSLLRRNTLMILPHETPTMDTLHRVWEVWPLLTPSIAQNARQRHPPHGYRHRSMKSSAKEQLNDRSVITQTSHWQQSQQVSHTPNIKRFMYTCSHRPEDCRLRFISKTRHQKLPSIIQIHSTETKHSA